MSTTTIDITTLEKTQTAAGHELEVVRRQLSERERALGDLELVLEALGSGKERERAQQQRERAWEQVQHSQRDVERLLRVQQGVQRQLAAARQAGEAQRVEALRADVTACRFRLSDLCRRAIAPCKALLEAIPEIIDAGNDHQAAVARLMHAEKREGGVGSFRPHQMLAGFGDQALDWLRAQVEAFTDKEE